MPIKTTKTPYGPIQVYDNDHIGKIFLSGQHYELDKIEMILKHTAASRRIAIDIGAHIGAHSIVYQKHFEKVVAFEPQDCVSDLLVNNLSSFTNCNIQGAALAHRNGWAIMNHDEETGNVNYGERSITLVDDKNIDTIKYGQGTPVRTLDSYQFQDVDLIKIDTEGTEGIILYGAQETIKKYEPVIFFECNGYKAFNQKNNIPEKYRMDIFDFLINECQYRQILRLGQKNVICVPRKKA